MRSDEVALLLLFPKMISLAVRDQEAEAARRREILEVIHAETQPRFGPITGCRWVTGQQSDR